MPQVSAAFILLDDYFKGIVEPKMKTVELSVRMFFFGSTVPLNALWVITLMGSCIDLFIFVLAFANSLCQELERHRLDMVWVCLLLNI